MKKLLLFALAAVFAFSALTLTACGDKENADTSNKGIVFSDENSEQSSKTTKNSGNSEKPNASSVGDTGGLPSYTAEQPTSSKISGGNSYTAQPTNSENFNYSASITGSYYIVPSTTPDPTLSIPIKLAIKSISNIGTVDGSNACLEKINMAQTAYNDVSAADKALVSNYSELVNAKAAYNKIAAETFVSLVGYLDTNFAVSAYYKSGLEQAKIMYSSLSAAEQSAKMAQKTQLDGLLVRFTNAEYAKSITDILLTLPTEVSAITAEHKVAVRQLKNLYAAATSAQKAVVLETAADAETRINAYINKLNADYPEHIFVYADNREAGTDFFHFDNELSGTGDGGPVDFNGRSLSDGGQLGEIYFTAPSAGILSMYISGHESTSDVAIAIDGALVETVHVIGAIEVSGSGRQEPINFYEVNIPKGGRVTITKSGGDSAIVFALVFF